MHICQVFDGRAAVSDGLIGASGAYKTLWPYLNQRYLDVVTQTNGNNGGLSWQKTSQSLDYKGIQPDFEHVLQEIMVLDEQVTPSVNPPTPNLEHASGESTLFPNGLASLGNSHYRAIMARNAYHAMSSQNG